MATTPRLKFKRGHRFASRAVLLTAALQSSTALAQGAPLSSDRPGFSSSTAVVAPKRVVLEMGLSSSPFADQPETSAPQLSVRVGVTRWLELRWRGPNFVLQSVHEGDIYDKLELSLADPVLGFKLARSISPKLHISSVSEVSLPIGSAPSSSARAQYQLDFNLGWQPIPSLTINPNALVATRWDGDWLTGNHSLRIAASLAAFWSINDKLTTYGLVYSWFQKPYRENLQLGAGVAYLLSADTQVDFSFEIPVLTSAKGSVLNVGMTRRW